LFVNHREKTDMNKKLLAAALVLAGFATVGAAQEGAGTEEEKLAVLPEFKAVDANEDGMIQASETEALAKELEEEYSIEFRFEVVDENRDGQINTVEYVAYDAMLAERLGIA
jgi:Ca2+-binding EF-hand superfamily protein